VEEEGMVASAGADIFGAAVDAAVTAAVALE
jgi:hypothetical protein